MPGLGLSIADVAERVRVPDPAAAALIARMTVPPGAARAGLIDALVRGLKEAGVWAKLDLLYCLAAHDAQAAQLNWVQSGFTLTPVNAPAFTADRGYAGNGTTSYLDTGWVPSANAVQYALDSASLGAWLNAGTDTADGTATAMGVTTSSGTFLVPRNSSDRLRGRVNTGSAANGANAIGTRLGFSVMSRTGSGTVSLYRNGVLDSTPASVSTSLPTLALFVCGLNSAGVFGSGLDNRIALAFAGAGLSAAEVAALDAAARTYLTAIGAA